VADPLLRRAARAAARPLHLVPPGAGAVAAAGLIALGQAPFAAAVGLLAAGAWGALVAWDLLTPPPPPAPDGPTFRSPAVREAHARVEAAARRVVARALGHDGSLGPALVELSAEAEDLLSAATLAAQRADAALALLSEADLPRRERELTAARARAREARDPPLRAALTEAAERQAAALQTWAGLRQLVDRIQAELAVVLAALDELDARVARLGLDDPGSAGPALQTELHDLSTRLQALERAAAQTLLEMR
jgi:hypothetical protein